MTIISKETPKGLTLVIPGRALWPKLTEPDTHFDKEGVFRTKLILAPEDKEALEEILASLRDEAVQKAVEEAKSKGKAVKADKVKLADLPLTELTDKDTGEGTGEFAAGCKCKASGVSKDGRKWDRKVPIFDARGSLIADVPEIWNGSRLKVNVLAKPFYVPSLGAGASLQLKGVQIIELATAGQDAASFGFGEEEGYVAEAGDAAPFEITDMADNGEKDF